MSRYDYEAAKVIAAEDPPFAALIMAALMRADWLNAAKLHALWPDICDETQARYDAPGGVLDGDAAVTT